LSCERKGIGSKIASLDDVLRWRSQLKREGKRVVFTNGCFDVLHRGHVDLLRQARALGDALVVGVNDDESVKRLKGEGRPLVCEEDRLEILGALEMVDRVVLFADDTPGRLIEAIVPDVLVKGADYGLEEIVGREAVERAGGRVVRVPLTSGRSTRTLVSTILDRFSRAARGTSSGKDSS
jgi:D-beta-D-heptose 7-phosphate kinase/D-beta-D-heptose 1-phosphate adenosyltransferase